jgi:hypothetical protein
MDLPDLPYVVVTPPTALVGCRHGADPENPQPCPMRCPVHAWPQSMFRRTFWRKRWVLKDEYRHQIAPAEGANAPGPYDPAADGGPGATTGEAERG